VVNSQCAFGHALRKAVHGTIDFGFPTPVGWLGQEWQEK
jgi:hypothetical protein